jgi:integrase
MQVQRYQEKHEVCSLLKLFSASFKSKETARAYDYHLKRYCNDLIPVQDPSSLLTLTQKEAEDTLIQFIITKKELGMSSSALNNYVAAVAKFYLINDKPINISRVNRFMPEPLKVKKDRGYQPEEILKVLELANERTRALILLLSSTGVRLGSISDLTMDELEDKGDIYKVIVYRNTRQEYVTYCTPEAKKALDTYFEIRRRDREVITEKSPVIREQYNRQSPLSIQYPRHTTKAALSRILEDIIERAGLRTIQHREGAGGSATCRKDVMLAHGFRKFFNTQLVTARINPLIKELLMGHLHVGLESSYYRPQLEDIQMEYEKAIDLLTVDPSNRLRKKVEKLEVEKTQIQALALELEKVKKALNV